MGMMLQRAIATSALTVLLGVPCSAQTVQALREPISRLDVAGNVGWLAAEIAEETRYDDWYSSGYAGLTAGWYWTNHLKTEIEAGWSATDQRRSYIPVQQIGSAVIHRELETDVATSRFALGQLYQFGRNAGFHPYLGAGADVTWERIDQRQLSYVGGVPPGNPQPFPRRTETHVRPFVALGFKAYMTPRAFFRTDLKVVIRGGADEVLTRFGFGVDF